MTDEEGSSVLRILPGRPPELLVYDRPSPCPYLGGRPARLPLRMPARLLRTDELDERLASGDRRQGPVLYRTSCSGCDACVPMRIDVTSYVESKTQRRILHKGDRLLALTIGPPTADEQRVELYNKHKRLRGLGTPGDCIDLDGYRSFLVDTCCETFEMRYHLDGILVALAVVDRGSQSLSAVYCHYEPELPHLSLGTYSILKQIELCRMLGMKYLYLGLYVVGSGAMAYKARFTPHQQLRDNRWVEVAKLTQPLRPCVSAQK